MQSPRTEVSKAGEAEPAVLAVVLCHWPLPLEYWYGDCVPGVGGGGEDMVLLGVYDGVP